MGLAGRWSTFGSPQVGVEGLPAHLELTGQHRFPFSSLCPLTQLEDLFRGEGWFPPLVCPSGFGLGYPLALALKQDRPLELGHRPMSCSIKIDRWESFPVNVGFSLKKVVSGGEFRRMDL